MNDATEAKNALYAKRMAIHPKLVHGKYRFIKWLVLAGTLGLYYLLPWLRWPRAEGEPGQAVLVDFEGGRLYFFTLEIWPDEFYLVTGVLIVAALALFLVSAIWGRLWCGFTCPQTVWTDLFIFVERLIEGDRNQRIALARQPMSFGKAIRKISKHTIWLLIAALTGGAWVLYFHDAPQVVRGLFEGTAPASAYIFIVILTFTTYALAGLMREQVCTYMCPWPRIQSALTDSRTFQVGYYAKRGEPRGKHKQGADWTGLGDCIDCQACVTACPMGIDIRDGDQLACINCGLCVDACDGMMKKVGLPTGLIAYGDDYVTAATPAARHRWPRLIRPRTIVYTGALALVSSLLVFGVIKRESVELGVERDRAPAFTQLSDGRYRNAITIRVLNKSAEGPFTISLDGPDTLEFGTVGRVSADRRLEFTLERDQQTRIRAFLVFPAAEAGEAVSFALTGADGAPLAEGNINLLTAPSRR